MLIHYSKLICSITALLLFNACVQSSDSDSNLELPIDNIEVNLPTESKEVNWPIEGESNTVADSVNFKSTWHIGHVTRTWIGPEYWTNPLQDWQLNNGRLECLTRRKNRNIRLLPYEVIEKKGAFVTSVELGSILPIKSPYPSAWVGFTIGLKGEFNDYRDTALKGKGMNAGITISGDLFIGDTKMGLKKVNIPNYQDGIRLELKVQPSTNAYYQVILSAYDLTGQLLGQIESKTIANQDLCGMLSLTCDFPKRKNIELGNVRRDPSFWFNNWALSGHKIKLRPGQRFGPIVNTLYTLDEGILKMTAQVVPVNKPEKQLVDLQIRTENDAWESIQKSKLHALARTAHFRFDEWDDTKDVFYRLAYNFLNGDSIQTEYLYGIIKRDPIAKSSIKLVGLSCSEDYAFPHTDISTHVKAHKPDLLFFAGDQFYEPDGGYHNADWDAPLEISTLDYLRKWYLFGWAYRKLTANLPTVIIMDDHDVFQGNLWGAGGRKATGKSKYEKEQSGGYLMPPQWVNMAQRTQTSHLPDPYDPKPIKQGINVYYTDMNYGGISFAILEDRKFKSGPFSLSNTDRASGGNTDKEGLTLLGDRQLSFLEDWTQDWENDTWMKVVLSQTIFNNLITAPVNESKPKPLAKEIYPTHQIARDFDTNGWPQTPRNEALKLIRKGFAFHIAGDQHLGLSIQYGVDQWKDASYALAIPSTSNHYIRTWFPPQIGANALRNAPRYTGDYLDGFGNKVSVLAAYNPFITNLEPSKLYDKATGYAVCTFDKINRNIKMEVWPRQSDPNNRSNKACDGWPIIINQLQNYERQAVEQLPKLIISGMDNPVVQVFNEKNEEHIYSIRIKGNSFQPKVFEKGSYTIKIGEPNTEQVQIKKGIKSIPLNNNKELKIKF